MVVAADRGYRVGCYWSPSMPSPMPFYVVALTGLSGAAELTPRTPLPPIELTETVGQTSESRAYRLSIKFIDDAAARANLDGSLRLSNHLPPPEVASLLQIAEGAQLSFSPRIHLSAERIAALEQRAAQRSGKSQPDLLGIHDVSLPEPASPLELRALAEQLQAHPLVEYAFVRPLAPPPPGDISPTTPDYTDQQDYLAADPGLDIGFAESIGATGQNVRLSDCEYGWIATHEDLMDRDLHLEAGQTVPDFVAEYGYDDHGTAVLGITSANHNGYGISGTVVDAPVYTYPEWSDEEADRRLTAIAAALADSAAGDVVMLEMQIGVLCTSCYGPAELDPDVWTVVRTGTDAGVVVVAAAGNGGQDLDEGWYASNYATWGDSGAILVGAGSASTRHQPLYYSTFGTRVDLQGWGERVFPLGYSSYAELGGDRNQSYTADFSGTSSATPIVTSAVVAVQDYFIESTGSPLSPEALRDLLVETGIPQGSGDHVGPFPDIAAAVRAFDDDLDGFVSADFGGEDCDDHNNTTFPGATDDWYDGVDSDCGGEDDFDQDGDGYSAIEHGGDDCDDLDPDITPENTPSSTCPVPSSGGGGHDGKASTCATAGASTTWMGLLVLPLLWLRRRS